MMNNEQSDTRAKILKHLQSTDPLRVADALEALKENGEVGDIPVLLDLFSQSKNQEIKFKISELFGNIKSNEAIPYFIDAIQNQKYTSIRKELVSVCWENGLDYGKHLSFFVDLLIHEDFIIAFEAYTVILNMVSTIEQEMIDREIDKIDQAMRLASDQKKPLMLDVIDFLPTIGH